MRGKADLLLMAGRSTNVSREGRREGATARKERERQGRGRGREGRKGKKSMSQDGGSLGKVE